MARDDTLAELLAELQRVPGDGRTYRAVLDVLRSFNGSRVRLSAARIDSLELQHEARRMLESGMPRPSIAACLMRERSATRSTAYRALAGALDEGPLRKAVAELART